MKLRNSIVTIIILVLTVASCSPKLSLKQWEGVGKGDSYLKIRDSLITFNGPDYFISNAKIQSISEDSILCRYYDEETGELKKKIQFGYSKSLKVLSVQINKVNYNFINTSKRNLLPKNEIEKVIYKIYGYDDELYKEYHLNSSGEIVTKNTNNTEISRQVNIDRVNEIYEKISILDLDEFVWSDKNFFMVSHAPCHCLEVHYNQESKTRYCRQIHNNYIKEILNDIKAE